MAKRKVQWVVCNKPVTMPIGESECELRLDKIEALESGSRACFSLLNGEVQDIIEVDITDSEKREGFVSLPDTFISHFSIDI
jgi:hypothetical protein